MLYYKTFGVVIYAVSIVIYNASIVICYATSSVAACIVIFTIVMSFIRQATGWSDQWLLRKTQGCKLEEEEARKNFHNFIVGKKDNEQKSFFNAIIV